MPSIIGIVPARMGSSRFPGKPLHPILGRPMLEHCFERARLYNRWDGLLVATCDHEIAEFCGRRGYPVIMTADTHVRALDRVSEAAGKCGISASDEDIVVCVQADEPLLTPDSIGAVIDPLLSGPNEIEATMLVAPIIDEAMYYDPNIVKVVHDQSGRVLYTSRSPIPHAPAFSRSLGAKRVGGIFGFRRHFLTWFTETEESPLEVKEACDSNRICDNGRYQFAAELPYRPYYSVDCLNDIAKVEAALPEDPLWGRY